MSEQTDNIPLVSICCVTYNHASYIRECLDGFMMQKTNFTFEVLIHDDASTDGTADIIKEYEIKYPGIIKPIYQIENQYSKGISPSVTFNFPRAKGKYIAMCEGDDYWTDPLKLQKQVDFLESHPDYVMCFTLYEQYDQEKGILSNDKFPNNIPNEGLFFDLYYYITCDNWITQPLTVLFCNEALDLKLYSQYKYSKDVTLFYYLLKQGKGYVFNECSGVYRISNTGVFSLIPHTEKNRNSLITIFNIYNIEKDINAALFLKRQYEKSMYYMGLHFIINNIFLIMKIICIMQHYWGIKYVCSVLRYRKDNIMSYKKKMIEFENLYFKC